MSDTKLCPFCAEEIKAAAVKCKHCRRMLNEAAPAESVTPKPPPPTPPLEPISPPSTESKQEQKPDSVEDKLPPETDPQEQKPKPKEEEKVLFSVVLKSIENEKAKFAFGKRLNEALKIPYNQMHKYVAPGKIIKSDLEEEEARKLIEELTIPGITLSLKFQFTPEQKKGFWAVLLFLIAIAISLYFGSKYKPMEEPKPKNVVQLCYESYNRVSNSCKTGDTNCLNVASCIRNCCECLSKCSETDDECTDNCFAQALGCASY